MSPFRTSEPFILLRDGKLDANQIEHLFRDYSRAFFWEKSNIMDQIKRNFTGSDETFEVIKLHFETNCGFFGLNSIANRVEVAGANGSWRSFIAPLIEQLAERLEKGTFF